MNMNLIFEFILLTDNENKLCSFRLIKSCSFFQLITSCLFPFKPIYLIYNFYFHRSNIRCYYTLHICVTGYWLSTIKKNPTKYAKQLSVHPYINFWCHFILTTFLVWMLMLSVMFYVITYCVVQYDFQVHINVYLIN